MYVAFASAEVQPWSLKDNNEEEVEEKLNKPSTSEESPKEAYTA